MKVAEKREVRFAAEFSQTCGLIAAVFGLLALFGWIAGIPLLHSFGADKIPMAPSTALLFALYGTLIFLKVGMRQGNGLRRALIVLDLFAVSGSLLLLILSSMGIRPDIEHLGIEITGMVEGSPIGHISPLTALCFVLAGITFLLVISPSPVRPWTTTAAFWSASAIILFSTVFVSAYFLGGYLLYGSKIIPPALPTSLAFMFLGLALLVSSEPNFRLHKLPHAHSKRATCALILTFLISSTGILTAGYFYFQNYEKQHRNGLEQLLSAITGMKVEGLKEWRRERLGDAAIFYKNFDFSRRVSVCFRTPENAEATRSMRAYLQQAQEVCQYDRISIFDAEGRERISFPDIREPLAGVISRRSAEALQTKQIIFEDFYRNEHNQRIYLTILVPILLNADGISGEHNERAIGILALRVDPDQYIYPLLRRWPGPIKTMETRLARRDGNDVLFLSGLKFKPDAALNLRIPLTNTDAPIVKALLGQGGIVEGVDCCGGEPVISAAHAVPNSPWFLATHMDIAEVYAPLRKKLWEMVLLVGTLLFGLCAGVALLWRRQQVRFYQEQFKSEAERKKAEEDRKKLEVQLIQSQKMEAIGQLAGGIAHDFNNMLQVIIGNADMALKDIAPDNPLAEHFLEIRMSARRSAELVKQLLSFARKQIIAPKVFDLNDTVAGTLKMLGCLIGEHIALLWKPAGNPCLIKMDPAQIDQVLVNLVVNARDAIGGKPGKITIETENAMFDEEYCKTRAEIIPGQYVMLAVSDDGCGMSKKIMERIFEPFFTTKPCGKETGLGLATVYGIIRQNNGFINVCSEPGKGAAFKIYLPGYKSEAVAEGVVLSK
jgi:signal transduction histidine kinase